MPKSKFLYFLFLLFVHNLQYFFNHYVYLSIFINFFWFKIWPTSEIDFFIKRTIFTVYVIN